MILTAEQIDKASTSKRQIRKMYRAQDESNLWPINGRFNATNLAIRQADKFERESGCALEWLEYCYFIEERISTIVNGEV